MKLTLEQRIAHGGHPVLRWMMDNIFIRTDPAGEGNIKADKGEVHGEDRWSDRGDHGGWTGRSDAGNDTGESVYDTRGLLFI